MALQTQTISLPLGAKLDEGTDPKLVNAQSAVSVCKNVIFRKDGRAEKAPGYLAETCECIAGGRYLTSYLQRLHSIESNGADLLVGGCGFDSSFNSYGEEYYNASRRGASAGVGVTTYNRIGKWFPIRQSKSLVAGNRTGATDPDTAYVFSTIGSLWTAWIEAGAVKLATCRASDGVALTTPGQWSITGMTTGMERVRILAVGAYVHVYASSKTDLRLAVFSAANYALGDSVASASVNALCGHAWHDFSTWAAALDCVIEATAAGWEGNAITVEVVGDSPLAGNVTIDVVAGAYGYTVTIHFEDGVSTVLDVTNAIDALAGADDVIGVTAGGYGTPAAVLNAPDDEDTITLTRARYSWDAIKITVAAVDVAIIAYCEETASQLEMTSRTAAGVLGAYGPATFGVYPGSALAICRCHLGTGGAAYGIAVVYEAMEGANVGDVCVATHSIDATFTAVLGETPFFACAADFASLTNLTICQELITEYQEGTACAGLAVWAEFAEQITTAPPWRHVVRGWIVNAATGAVKRDLLPRYYNHRLMSRALEYDRRSHVWVCHESETWPVASLLSAGDLLLPTRTIDNEATWLRAVARWPGIDDAMDFGAGLGSIVSTAVSAPSTTYWWPAVCAETQDALDVRLNLFDYLATCMRSATMGNGKVAGGGQLMGIEPGLIRPHGFAHPPEIESITTAYAAGTYTDALKAGARYKYLAIYEYMDGNGELHQSAPSVPVEIVTAAAAYSAGQTLTITTATDEIVLELEEGYWDNAAPSVWQSLATTTATIVIPAKVYADWEELCDAIQMAGNSAIILATGQVSGTFYCWKEDNPCADTPAAEWIADLGIDKIKMYYYNPGASYEPVTGVGNCWFLRGVSCSTSSATAAIGFGVADLVSGVETRQRVVGVPECVFASAVQGGYSVDTPVSTDSASVTLAVRPLIPGEAVRNADEVKIAIYRTEADGTTFHKVYARDGYSGYEAPILDHMSDAEALTRALAYTTGEPGDILENTTPVGLVLCAHRDRVWCVDEEDPRFVYVSVPKAQGFAVEFTEFIKVPLPAPVLALRSAGEVMLAFTADACYAIHGQGPAATGQGEFAAPRLLAPAGVDSQAGVCSLGDLTIWHSASRGLWALDRGYQSQEIGKNCLDLLAGGSTVKSMVEYAAERRLEINLSNGEALWLEQRFDRWTQQTGFAGVNAACVHLGFPWHVNSTQVCYQGGTTWTRGGTAHAMTVRTAWIHVGALTGMQRVRRESILGDWRDSHTISIKRYIDFSTTAETTRTLAITADPGPYLVKHHPLTQRCSEVMLEISDVPPVTGGAGFRLTALELEVGVKPRGYMHKGKDR